MLAAAADRRTPLPCNGEGAVPPLGGVRGARVYMYRYGGTDWTKKEPPVGVHASVRDIGCLLSTIPRRWRRRGMFTQYHLTNGCGCPIIVLVGWYNARLGHLRLQSGKGFHMAQNGGGKGWQTDTDTGTKVMPASWGKLLDWLLLGPERAPSTQRDWATENDMHEDSIRRIKRDPRFVREWDRRAAELNVNPERVQSVVDALWQRASAGDTKAASLYLQYVEKFTPKRRVVVDDEREAVGMSDAELADALEFEVVGLRAVS